MSLNLTIQKQKEVSQEVFMAHALTETPKPETLDLIIPNLIEPPKSKTPEYEEVRGLVSTLNSLGESARTYYWLVHRKNAKYSTERVVLDSQSVTSNTPHPINFVRGQYCHIAHRFKRFRNDLRYLRETILEHAPNHTLPQDIAAIIPIQYTARLSFARAIQGSYRAGNA